MKKSAHVALSMFFLLGIVFGSATIQAADYPERAIEILVPFGAGGGSDTAARAVAEGMKPQLKNGVVVNNMPGGGATKGMLYVSQQPADGYSVLAVTTSHLIDAVKPKTRAQHPERLRPPVPDSVGHLGGDHLRRFAVQDPGRPDRVGQEKPQRVEVRGNLSRRLV